MEYIMHHCLIFVPFGMCFDKLFVSFLVDI
jgi:hypothetical protein